MPPVAHKSAKKTPGKKGAAGKKSAVKAKLAAGTKKKAAAKKPIAKQVATQNKAEVVVVGSANTDLIAYVPRLPKPGETLNGSSFVTGFGGKGANQCVMAAKLGARTAMVAKVGVDSFGENTIKNFKTFKVDVAHVTTTTKAATGVAPIAVDEKGENSIIVVLGANDHLSVADVNKAKAVIKGAKVLLCQHEIMMETNIAALQLAKDAGIISILNPAPAQPPLPQEAYSLPTIFCVNETEAQLFTGTEVTDLKSAEKACEALTRKGASTVLLTLGSKGAMLYQDGKASVVPCPKVKAIDTSGAGDAFLGAFAYFLARYDGKLDMLQAMERANQVAAVSVQGKGTQSSYKLKKDLPATIFKH